ncbi:MAG: 5'-methylthioadenosine/adenosylhomocysteine nucleosidase [Eubacteriales bacterium]
MIGILAAMQVELAYFVSVMEDVESFTFAKLPYYRGKLDGREIIVAIGGVGTVNTAVHGQIMIDKFGVDTIIQSGIAGGLVDDIHTLDMVVADKVVYHDMQPHILEQFEPLEPIYSTTASLVEKAKGLDDFHVGTIASGDWFVETAEHRNDIAKRTGALCCEMEGAALGQLADLNGIDFLVVRCISDNANEKPDMTYAQFEQLAADKCGNFVRKLVKKL